MIKIYDYNKDDISVVLGRTQLDNVQFIQSTQQIVNDVKQNGDKALFDYALKFDKQVINAQNIKVERQEIEQAYKHVDPKLVESIKRAKCNILDYHQRQTKRFDNEFFKINSNSSSKLGWIYRPLNRVGLYVPGGKASYPSTVLMTALPAIAAGVEQVIVATPNLNNPLILVACNECGIEDIYKVGGAQAIAAMAYGTQSMPKVDLIAGPGNVFVALAKKLVFGHVAIDMIAGPSEVLIIADDSCNPSYVASDMLSQAEHDEQAASILITTSHSVAQQVAKQIEIQTAKLSRQEIINKSLGDNGAIIVVDNYNQAVELSDTIAPEHLELCTHNAEDLALKIKNAGAIFIGNYSPEPLGDYYAGASHVLPTSGSARFSSVLSVDTFMKKISYINYSKNDLIKASDDIVNIALSEGFDAHANTIKIRKEL